MRGGVTPFEIEFAIPLRMVIALFGQRLPNANTKGDSHATRLSRR
jgi:hypothetical protein